MIETFQQSLKLCLIRKKFQICAAEVSMSLVYCKEITELKHIHGEAIVMANQVKGYIQTMNPNPKRSCISKVKASQKYLLSRTHQEHYFQVENFMFGDNFILVMIKAKLKMNASQCISALTQRMMKGIKCQASTFIKDDYLLSNQKMFQLKEVTKSTFSKMGQHKLRKKKQLGGILHTRIMKIL